jgi:CBS-domain-containing membrane protein
LQAPNTRSGLFLCSHWCGHRRDDGHRTVHPPARSNPVIVFLGHAGWNFLLFPVLSGAVLLVLVAWAYNNATRKTRYPQYW